MNQIERFELRNREGYNDEFELVLYLDPPLTEFANELGTDTEEKRDLTSMAMDIISERFPRLKVTIVKVVLGGVAAAAIPLTSPDINAQAAGTDDPGHVAQSDSIYYHVAPGDTLWKISVKFGTSIDNIKTANHLTTDVLQLNQLLIIPKAIHVVASGDSLSVIARDYGSSVEGIKQANNLTSDVIRVGAQLIIPTIIGGIPDTTVQPPPPPASQTGTSYTVVSGDSLSVIAKRFGTTVEAIKSTNQLTSDVIRVGQILTIPSGGGQVAEPRTAPSPTGTSYTVVAGDSLWGISLKFNVSVDDIRRANQLQTDVLQIGQTLQIPTSEGSVTSPSPPPPPADNPGGGTQTGTSYTVVSGDSLSVIAKRYNITVDALKQANQLTSDVIRVGQVLTIPAATATPTAEPPANPVSDALVSVQKNLQTLGYYTVPTMTGRMDTSTSDAIKAFQADYGLAVTGTADDATSTAIAHAVVKKDLIRDSANYLGVPYKWGGTTPAGFDCSGFVYYMFNKQGVDFARNTSGGLYHMGTTISRSKLQPGDLVFFAVNSSGSISHVGFYMGNNQFISATSSKGIATYSMDNSYWKQYYVGAKRVY